jgi:hypothetical protein
VRRQRLRMMGASATGLLVVGCGIVELGTEDPGRPDDHAEPVEDTEPAHPGDEDVDNAEGID